MKDHKSTLNLPKTSFPMKAELTKREPEMLRRWNETGAYEAMVTRPGPLGRYVLHDGPPYANGHIHLGTALNKILKDFIIKSRNMAGYRAEYVPGWDCHGLPIEHKVEQELGGKSHLPTEAIRQRCREYATEYVTVQREEFKRLGVLGTWESPYLTMHPHYEAATTRILADFAAAGVLTRSRKPIHWCCSCETALAEAEVEYEDHNSDSIYVPFQFSDPQAAQTLSGADIRKTSIVIWTTTPWTLPDNMAVAVHPQYDYALVEHGGNFYVLAAVLLPECAGKFGWTDYQVINVLKGALLEGLKVRHPFYSREVPIVLADYVTLETGTGAVHTAPGHGREDYETGLRYNLEVLSPINDQGRFTSEVKFFAGLTVFEANAKVIEKLKENNALLYSGRITHSYPHCWRCKKPVIFRATIQWFISMQAGDLRAKALAAIDREVEFIPAWGRERIRNMVAARPDWCISRQRLWGVPIAALICKDCNHVYGEADFIRKMADRYENFPTGCDYWFQAPLAEIAGDLRCPQCGGVKWRKETDILDVWFDSGTSFAAVLEQRPECAYPADLYLEGSDQHRGWFQSSLLASIGSRSRAPYKAVLTHGYVVDGMGKKMSKSIGNVVAPHEIIERYGAEILRLWVSSVDYREDIRISDEILGRLVDAYRRLRNTCRFILGNLYDLSERELLAPEEMLPLDRYNIDLAEELHRQISAAYLEYDFHKVFHALHNFCVTDLSSAYLDILKDRLYTCAPDSRKRRSAQSAIYHILLIIMRDMAPILSFTAEETLDNLPAALKPAGAEKTVFGLREQDRRSFSCDQTEKKILDLIMEVRSEVTAAVEPARRSGLIGHSLDSKIILYRDDRLRDIFNTPEVDLREIFIVSQVEIKELAEAPADIYESDLIPGLKIEVRKAEGQKCQRCWNYNLDIDNAGLCPKCREACPAG